MGNRLAHSLAMLAGAWLFLIAGAVPAQTEQRVALIIGNSAYKESPLANPGNDAADMAKALSEAGFKVILRRNASTRAMREAVREFGSELRRAQVGLFYYAGHGVQLRGNNYLIPVSADIRGEADVEDQAIDANYVLRTMEEAQTKVNIVILDACRNNPYASGFRSASRGLAQMTGATGTLIAFSTAPGAVAQDGSGRNGLYTQHLLASLRQPDTNILQVFQRTRAGVVRDTAGKQTPWELNSLVGDFYFRPGAQIASAVPSATAIPAPVADPEASDRTFWESVKVSNNPDELKVYLEQFPNGLFATLALARLKSLNATPGAATSPSTPVLPTGDNAANDRAFWNSVKDSKNPEELQAYINQFPDGLFVALARSRIRLNQSSPNITSPTQAQPPQGAEFGKAKIYVSRAREFLGGYPIEIFDGNQKVGTVQAGTYLFFESPIGDRSITALVPPKYDDRNIVATEKMKLEPGKSYYLLVEAIYGPKMKIDVLNEVVGQSVVGGLVRAKSE